MGRGAPPGFVYDFGAALTRGGRQLVLNHDVELANGTIALVWISSANVRAVADKGRRIIHAVRCSEFIPS